MTGIELKNARILLENPLNDSDALIDVYHLRVALSRALRFLGQMMHDDEPSQVGMPFARLDDAGLVRYRQINAVLLEVNVDPGLLTVHSGSRVSIRLTLDDLAAMYSDLIIPSDED